MLNWYERKHMENRNLDKALDIVSKLITGENVSERGENAALYQEYNNKCMTSFICHLRNLILTYMNITMVCM